MKLAPSEFWRMVPRHFWWLLEVQEPAGPGVLSDAEYDELHAMLTAED